MWRRTFSSLCASLGSSSATSPPQPPQASTPLSGTSGGDDMKPEQVRALFAAMIASRQGSNLTIRKYISSLHPADWYRAIEAINGALDVGYRVDHTAYHGVLDRLLNSGQHRLALVLYQRMVGGTVAVVPDTETYNRLLQLCLDTGSVEGATTLFRDMQRRGRRPNLATYETMINVYATEKPYSNWKEAVVLFDIAKQKDKRLTATLYESIMRVYLNMSPFDWRVVYNAYYEMRMAKPRIPFDWSTYELVSVAMNKGDVNFLRKSMTYLDAWVQITPMWSSNFIMGGVVFLVACLAFRGMVGLILQQTETKVQSDPGLKGVVEMMHQHTGQGIQSLTGERKR